MIYLFLLDVRPEPTQAAGIGAVILLAIVVLIFVAILIGGFVFLLIWRKRRSANRSAIVTMNAPQPSSPNQ
jgi:hypothetical protein